MSIAIRYFSKTGNTKKVAYLIGQQLNLPAYSIEKPLDKNIDTLILGGAVHIAGADHRLKAYIKNLDAKQIGSVTLFGTSGGFLTISKQLTKILCAKGIRISDTHLFLHGLLPGLGNISQKQHCEIQKFVSRLPG